MGRVLDNNMIKGTAFTRSRSYAYGSNGLVAMRTLPLDMVYNTTYKPHAVQAVDNTGGLITDGPQCISTTSSGSGHSLMATTDHIGNLLGLFDVSDYEVMYTYDAWGNKTKIVGSDICDRGFTGHEHLDLLGLIDMNGRLYDPNLGRFLSPDPYVQAPSNPQNYNRYSYCLNNPLKYTDPDGELFGTITGFFADIIRNTIQDRDLSDWDWSRTKMGWEIDKGLFKTDPNKSDGARVWEFISRLTWQLPQTIVGDLFVSSANGLGFVKDVSYGYGMTAVDMGLKDGSAVTIGFYSAGPKGYKADWRDHTFVHEYGHYIQSQQHGPLFLMTVGVPSLQSAILQTDNPNSPRHRNRWFEADASYKGAEYFDKYYGSGNEDYKEDSEDFFDINSFKTGKESLYTNPRTNEKNERYHPTSAIFHWTDIIIYFPVIGLIPWFWYK